MNSEPSRVSGLVVTAAISSIRTNYGDPLLHRALQKLTPEERQSLTSTGTPLRWIDVSLHERFLDYCYEEARLLSGESRETFDQRGIEEGGGTLIKGAYRFIFSMISTTKILDRVLSLQKKSYNNIDITEINNQKESFSVTITIPEDMRHPALREVNYGYIYILKMANQTIKNHKTEITQQNKNYKIKCTIKYTA